MNKRLRRMRPNQQCQRFKSLITDKLKSERERERERDHTIGIYERQERVEFSPKRSEY